jgi:beta-galactosidase GanA
MQEHTTFEIEAWFECIQEGEKLRTWTSQGAQQARAKLDQLWDRGAALFGADSDFDALLDEMQAATAK